MLAAEHGLAGKAGSLSPLMLRTVCTMQWTEIDNQQQRGLYELDMCPEINYAWCLQGCTQMQCGETLSVFMAMPRLRPVAGLHMLNDRPCDADHAKRAIAAGV